MKICFVIVFAAAVLVAAPLCAQDTNPDRVTVSWSDPSRPGLLKINLLNGAITVKTHSGPDVIIQSKGGTNRRDSAPAESGGLRRIDQNASGLRVEEQNNVMSIGSSVFNRGANLDIEVPMKTNLNLHTVNGGDINVDGVEGEIEANNTNGSVYLNNVAGSVVAHALNGKLIVSLRQVTANKAMSFTSMNGTVDVTFPANTKSNLKMRTDNGEIYSDFDIQLRPSDTKPTVEDTRRQGGRYRIQIDKSMSGVINGGGPEFDLRSFNGNIYIRKGK